MTRGEIMTTVRDALDGDNDAAVVVYRHVLGGATELECALRVVDVVRFFAARTVSRRNKAHGMCRTREYRAWKSMKSRCNNPKRHNFHRYGGRGISVCAEWAEFATFLSDVGACPGPGYELDRINPDGNYEPGNVRWTTHRENALNRSASIRVLRDGKYVPACELAAKVGVARTAFWARVRKGWDVEVALSTPPQRGGRKKKAA